MAHPQASAEEMLQAIVSAVHRFTDHAPQSDDLTLFIVKRQPV
jgi:serine phosphatase RsbU (regulator of sigma subunit)